MQRPQQGICSTRHVEPIDKAPPIQKHDVNTVRSMVIANNHDSEDSILMPPQMPNEKMRANIVEFDDDSEANIFIFPAFADKRTGMLYSDLTGAFPFMSPTGNICFLVVYHYTSNAILALPIATFANKTILTAYQTQFKRCKSKGHKI
jgi:hypothetical protein